MTRSTEQLDDLLEWHPGPPDTASANPLRALAWGARRALSAAGLIGCLWLFHFLWVGRAAPAALAALRATTTWAEAAAAVLQQAAAHSSFVTPSGAGSGYAALLLASAQRSLWVPSAYFVIFYSAGAGAAISYLHSPRPAPLLAQLGATSGAYVGRFLRLLLLGFALAWLVTMAVAALPAPPSALGATAATMFVYLFTYALAAALDYARVRTVARDARSMLLEAPRALRFFVGNLPRTLALEILALGLGALASVAALLAYVLLRAVLEPATAGFVADQLHVAALLWVRLALWGAMLALYQGVALRRLARRA